MTLDEFVNFANSIVDKDYPLRETPISYNLAMRLQVNEIEYDRHMEMTFPEFLEAFCRVVDKYSPIPPNENPVIHK